MRHFFIAFIITCIFIIQPCLLKAQADDVWTLQRCVQYAVDHNISIQQDVINARLAKYTLLQSQLAQLPNLNATSSYGRSYGRSIDPTSNQFVEANYNFLSLGGTANVLVFGWFQQRNRIAGNKFSLQAANADLDQLKNDVSLNVANGFLRIILAQEQIHISEKQVQLSAAQLSQTRSFVSSGRMPELNAVQLESQLATDSSNLITAIANYTAALIDEKAMLNLDFNLPFNVQAPDVQLADQLTVSELQPEQIYQKARAQFGSILGSQLRVSAAEKNLAATKGNLYPQLSLTAQYGTNYASTYKELAGYNITGRDSATQYYIRTDNGITPVYEPGFTYSTRTTPFFKQLDNNARQTISANLNVPIFNGWQSQYAVRQAKINLLTQQLNEGSAELTLKQNVYKAYSDATSSIQKYYAAKHAADASQRALEFAQKRSDLGLLSTVDFLVTQNAQYNAQSNLALAKYDLIFKLKVIDYYLGKDIKL